MKNNIIGIICAVESEKNELLKKYNDYTVEQVYDLSFYIFYMNNIKVVMTKCGVGKINATRATQILIDKFDVKFIINYGTAGSIDPTLKHGDIVIAKACVQADADCTVLGVEKGKFNKEDELYINSDLKVVSYVEEKLKETMNKVLVKNIATFDQFIIDDKFNINLHKQFNVLCADMESVAVAITCKSCNVPYVIIRGISNSIYEKDPINSYNYLSSTISSFCVQIIEKIIC